MTIRTNDPIKDAENYMKMQERLLQKRPVCVLCGEHIQDEDCYYINHEYYCNDCIEDCKREVEDGAGEKF